MKFLIKHVLSTEWVTLNWNWWTNAASPTARRYRLNSWAQERYMCLCVCCTIEWEFVAAFEWINSGCLRHGKILVCVVTDENKEHDSFWVIFRTTTITRTTVCSSAFQEMEKLCGAACRMAATCCWLLIHFNILICPDGCDTSLLVHNRTDVFDVYSFDHVQQRPALDQRAFWIE